MSVELLLRRLRPVKGAKVLDLGCGSGDLVRVLRQEGLDAYGCDFADTAGSDLSSQDLGELLRPIPSGAYRIPFEDSEFDYVISSQVLEHVIDYPGTFAEILRILKPGGVSLHVFPPRHVPIEPHVFVPRFGHPNSILALPMGFSGHPKPVSKWKDVSRSCTTQLQLPTQSH